MKFISRRESKHILAESSLPKSLLDDNVLVNFNNEVRIVSKDIEKVNLSDFAIKSIGIKIEKMHKAV